MNLTKNCQFVPALPRLLLCLVFVLAFQSNEVMGEPDVPDTMREKLIDSTIYLYGDQMSRRGVVVSDTHLSDVKAVITRLLALSERLDRGKTVTAEELIDLFPVSLTPALLDHWWMKIQPSRRYSRRNIWFTQESHEVLAHVITTTFRGTPEMAQIKKVLNAVDDMYKTAPKEWAEVTAKSNNILVKQSVVLAALPLALLYGIATAIDYTLIDIPEEIYAVLLLPSITAAVGLKYENGLRKVGYENATTLQMGGPKWVVKLLSDTNQAVTECEVFLADD